VSIGLIAIVFFRLDAWKALAQDVHGDVYVEDAELSPPKYPPLARTARISGDVKLELQLRPDGTVSSVRVISGHPLLAPAAVESAKGSRFTCYNCVMPSSYIFTYTFGFREDGDCTVVTLRAPRCLYLWRCGPTQYKNGLRPPVIIHSKDRITVGADNVCVETDAATNHKQ
jgi:TonB family protein